VSSALKENLQRLLCKLLSIVNSAPPRIKLALPVTKSLLNEDVMFFGAEAQMYTTIKIWRNNMPDLESQRAVTRRANRPLRIPSACEQKRIRIPSSYEEFESQIMRWMSRCVVTNSIQDERGLPLNRHQLLVQDNISLLRLWGNVRRLVGSDITIYVTYIRSNAEQGYRVDAIQFSLGNRSGVVHEPDDFRAEERRPDEDVRRSTPIPGGIPPLPPSTFIPPGRSLLSSFRKVMTRLLQGYRHALAVQREVPLFRGRVDGYCDTLARVASHPRLIENGLRVRGFRPSSLVNLTAPVSEEAILRGGGLRIYEQGYREGRRAAFELLAEMERLSSVELPTYQSVDLLNYLRNEYGPGPNDIRTALVQVKTLI
jgi:hypothetical protein